MSMKHQSTLPTAIAVAELLNDSAVRVEAASVSRPAAAAKAPTLRLMGAFTATMLVVASMVGTGVFTTTGLLLEGIGSSPAVLLAWVFGGVIAFFGALSYVELVAALPRNGGEYQLLGRIFHPAVGFVAGWVSLVVGFSAPIAAAAIGFGVYFQAVVPGLNPLLSATLLIVLFSGIHAAHVTLGSGMQNLFTIAKVVVVLAFIGGGLALGDMGHIGHESPTETLGAVMSPAFAVGLIFVSFAYSGWNGAAYIAGEIKNPARSLPKALALGTGVVTLLYLGLNMVFMGAAPAEELSGTIDVGTVAATHLFGTQAGRALSGVISLLLVSSVSAMIMSGPRVYQAIGEDYRCFSFLKMRSGKTGPFYAILLQAVAAIIMLLTSSFDALLTYIGFTLSLSAGLTVIGVFVMRKREPDLPRPYRCWGYPVTPVLFILLSCWMVVFTLIEAPVVAVAGAVTVFSGLGVWAMARRFSTMEDVKES